LISNTRHLVATRNFDYKYNCYAATFFILVITVMTSVHKQKNLLDFIKLEHLLFTFIIILIT